MKDFHSILYKDATYNGNEEEPDFFGDLNLDQIVNNITAGKKEYNLKSFFYRPLSNLENIKYRQQIMQELENNELYKKIDSFAKKMRRVRQFLNLVQELSYKYNQQGWLLEAVDLYCQAVNELTAGLKSTKLKSLGFLSFKEYLLDYVDTDYFNNLQREMEEIKEELADIKYCLNIYGGKVRVQEYQGEKDYRPEIEQTFARFKENGAKDYKNNLRTSTGMNHVEAKIIERVAKLYPDIFSRLDNYYNTHSDFLDQTISVFDREVQFYLAYLENISSLKKAGLSFCYPILSTDDKNESCQQMFDLALAQKYSKKQKTVISNDFYLEDRERIIVVTGPNQGGKTTFARSFGQLHYLANLGCPIPAKKAKLFLFEGIFTHFEREENIKDLHGKLESDLLRIRKIINQITDRSLVILNEIFTSTTARDAVFLGKKVLKKIIKKDSIAICVTFLDELTSMSPKVVSMVAQVESDDPTNRTYKLIREKANGVAYAVSIAEKYRLTYDCLKERIS
ncbi:MutS-related protein [Halanaerobium hydrogeniformans]|uniref:DNA mismatch repair protein MutS domain protein n=1 Tax=Halanaerobium hydrogeniformans TaxID=656519 RepID=E4RKP3_HALHG|nr:DNA mismatch repair protein MutS [Halanaerobium hydrogeniformans]ADQ14713.1 DNA mismatch repair protein MutS domain protein [Halanaerobium hydrogeniformans]